MWEGLKQGLTAPETALDGCFSHSASVYRTPFKCVEGSWWGEGHEPWGPLDPGFISAGSAAYSFVTLTMSSTSQSLGFLVYKLG